MVSCGSMALIQVSALIFDLYGHVSLNPGLFIWIVAVAMHVTLLIAFIPYFMNFDMTSVCPIWIPPFMGLSLASSTGALVIGLDLAVPLFSFSLLFAFTLGPLALYRFHFHSVPHSEDEVKVMCMDKGDNFVFCLTSIDPLLPFLFLFFAMMCYALRLKYHLFVEFC